MSNDYLHLQLHQHRVDEALARAEHDHATDLPAPSRGRLPGLLLDFFTPRRRRALSVRRATMTA